MKRIWSGLLAVAIAGTARAQTPIINSKLAELQPDKFAVPLCSIKPEDKTKKGVDALKDSYKPKEDRAAKLAEAKALILESIATEEQDQNPAAWYYLARVYLRQGDVGGVDTAFSKAQALQPQCELDINQYRQNNWANLANAGLELQRAGDVEGALTAFRDASRLFDGLPHVVSNMGVLYANQQKYDSAASYFSKAVAIATKAAETDSTLIEDRNANALNLALMYQRMERHQDAITLLHRYLTWDPGSVDARKALSQSFRGAGMADSAAALDAAMIEEMSQRDLDSLDTQDLMNVGVAAFNAQRYDASAEAFAKAVLRNPFSRDALYNLANTYLAMKNYEQLVATSEKLAALEPMNEDVYRLLGQGHKGLGHDPEVLKAAERLVGLPVNIEVTAFQLGRDAARLECVASGRSPTDAQGKAIPPAPLTLVVEFLTASGDVVDTEEVEVPIIETGKTQPITLDAQGADIAAWRYRRK